MDIERRIAEVYQLCRTPEEIERAFDELQAKFDDQITSRLAEARKVLLENFDEAVVERLRVRKEDAQRNLTDHQRWLLNLTSHELKGDAKFNEPKRFTYSGITYHLEWQKAEANGDEFYNSMHALAQDVIKRATERKLPVAELAFDYAGYGGKISELEALIGARGWLEVSVLSVESLEREDALILSGCIDTAEQVSDYSRSFTPLDEDLCRKLLLLPARVTRNMDSYGGQEWTSRRRNDFALSKLNQIQERNGKYFDEEVLKLDGRADDLKGNLEREIQTVDQKIEEARIKARVSMPLTTKLEVQKELRTLEKRRNSKRRELYEKQDGIDRERDGLIRQTESRLLKRRPAISPLFLIRWVVQ